MSQTIALVLDVNAITIIVCKGKGVSSEGLLEEDGCIHDMDLWWMLRMSGVDGGHGTF